MGFPVITYRADWNKWRKAAGAIRNQEMIDDGKPDYGLALPGGKGTQDMINRLTYHRIPTKIISMKDYERIVF